MRNYIRRSIVTIAAAGVICTAWIGAAAPGETPREKTTPATTPEEITQPQDPAPRMLPPDLDAMIAAAAAQQAADEEMITEPAAPQEETAGGAWEPSEAEDSEPEPETATPVEVYEPEAPGENMRYAGTYRVTGYDTCVSCCGKTDGITASGTYATAGRTVATGYEFDVGTVLYIEGIGYRVVEDRGVGNGSIDVVCEDHPACYAITGYYDVWIVEG